MSYVDSFTFKTKYKLVNIFGSSQNLAGKLYVKYKSNDKGDLD